MQKEKVLSDLYNGKLNPVAQKVIHGSEYQKAMCSLSDLEEQLNSQLDEKQKQLLKEFVSAQMQLTSLGSEERFTYGFRLGAKLIIEIFSQDDEQLKPITG